MSHAIGSVCIILCSSHRCVYSPFFPSIFKFSCHLAYITPSFLQLNYEYCEKILPSPSPYLFTVCESLFMALTDLVFLLCVFSASTISFLNWHNQTYKQDSECGCTMELATTPGPSLPFFFFWQSSRSAFYSKVSANQNSWAKPALRGQAVG